ncbi:carboxyl transferase domain-containing protein [Moorella naiadis]|uniref:acyl-CoA carboxylase subunit beta n=1 Tax=Moorella naiadis (nom. illeg.) TaxID=3093670 RepID=UPI003D9C9E82
MEDITARLADLEARRARVVAGGGEERIAKQHAAGKYTARERLNLLLDPGSFLELDQFIRHRATDFGMQNMETPGEGVITGSGTINGRPVYVYAQDFTVMGGSLGEMHAAKICKVLDLALKTGVPVIGLNDSGGARIQEGVAALNGYGEIFRRNTHASGVIPQIAAIMGPCAGGAVYSPGLMDFIFMVDNTAQMFITGPQVIKAVTGEEVSPLELGGAATHATRSGVAHFRTPTEEDCLHLIRTLLDYLPANNLEDPPFRPGPDPAERQNPHLRTLVPVDANKPYNVKEIIYGMVDDGLFLEVQAQFAVNIVIGLARLAGYTIGIVANQPQHLAGCLDIDAADKAARFVRFCDAFNIPLLTLVDTPGYLPGVGQEQGGIIRHGAKLLYAFAEATVPKLTLVLRKAYGGAYLAMCSRSLGADHVAAWPTAEIAVMGPDGAANIIFRQEISQAKDPARVRQEKIAAYREKFAHPYVAAGLGLVDAVIDPALTRPHLVRHLVTLLSKRESRPGKKHGNFPV